YMLLNVGHPARHLERTRLGPLTLRGVKPGHWRFLTAAEVEKLREAAHTTGDETSSPPPPSPRPRAARPPHPTSMPAAPSAPQRKSSSSPPPAPRRRTRPRKTGE